MTPSKTTTAPAAGSRTAAATAATSSGSAVTRARRTAPAPPLTGGTRATSSPGAMRASGAAYSRLMAATQERGASSIAASRSPHRGAVRELDLDAPGTGAFAQPGEETDGDDHARRVRWVGWRRSSRTWTRPAVPAWSTSAARPATERYARARAVVRMSPEAAARVARGDNPKGDVVAVARIAAIQAAKRTDELIPLCHSLPLTHVDPEIAVDPEAGTVTLVVETRTTDRTGVEMEAMVALRRRRAHASTTWSRASSRASSSSALELLDKTGGKADFHR